MNKLAPMTYRTIVSIMLLVMMGIANAAAADDGNEPASADPEPSQEPSDPSGEPPAGSNEEEGELAEGGDFVPDCDTSDDYLQFIMLPCNQGTTGWSFNCPPNAIEGQFVPCELVYELPGIVPAHVAYEVLQAAGDCELESVDSNAGSGVSLDGALHYVVFPEGTPSTGNAIHVGSLAVDVIVNALGAGKCVVEVQVLDQQVDPLGAVVDPLGAVQDLQFDILPEAFDILPDISTTPIDLGAMHTAGCFSNIDRATAISPTKTTGITVISPSSKVLAVVSANIAHWEGMCGKDYGTFSITPGADMLLVEDLAPGIGLAGDIVNSRVLHDDTSAQEWLTYVTIETSPEGTDNEVTLTGAFVDDGVPQGEAKTVVTVTGIQDESAALLLSDMQMELASLILERTGSVMIPLGGGVFVIL